LVIIG